MAVRNTATSYGSIAKLFHWLIFLLVLIMIPVGYYMDGIVDKATRGQVYNLHKLIGLLILSLMLLRLLWALANPKPRMPFQTPAWQCLTERCMHFIFYLVLIAMPLAGFLGAVASGHPPHLGHITFQLPIAQSKAVAEFAFNNIHAPLAIILIVLISIHTLAALYHHLIKRDDILRRMLPGRGRR